MTQLTRNLAGVTDVQQSIEADDETVVRLATRDRNSAERCAREYDELRIVERGWIVAV